MSDNLDNAYQSSVTRFWRNYLFVLEKYSIPEKARPWYRKHVEAYIVSNGDIKLRHHLALHVDDYLTAKGRMPGVNEWQFRQTVDALKILFKDFLMLPWAQNYDWTHWRAYARELEPDHPSLMRDGNPSLLVAPSHNSLIQHFRENYPELHRAFVKTLRIRGMAVAVQSDMAFY